MIRKKLQNINSIYQKEDSEKNEYPQFSKINYQSNSFYPSPLNKHILQGRKDNLNTTDKKRMINQEREKRQGRKFTA